MRSSFRAVIATMAVTTLVGCGTILHGRFEPVGIASLPRGATVTVDDTYVGSTPLVALMPRIRSHTVLIECTGYESYSAVVRRHTSKSGWLNLAYIPYGLFGLGIDLAGGGMYELSTEQLAVRLVADPAASSSGEGRCAPGEHTPEPRTTPGDPPSRTP
jgi:hypothetical protein